MFRIRKIKRPSIKSAWLIALLSAYSALALNTAFWKFMAARAPMEGAGGALFFLGVPVILFALGAVFFSLVVIPYLGKPAAVALLVVSAGADYVMGRYGISIDSDMIRNVFETDLREASDFVTTGMFLHVLAFGIVPAALVAVAKIKYLPFLKELRRRAAIVLAALCAAAALGMASYKEYASFGRNDRGARKLVVPFNFLYGTARYFQLEAQAKRRLEKLDEDARFVPFKDPYPTVIVLVLGETARAANFQLNGYGRPTNPLLSKQDIMNFPNMLSCGTSTAVSLPCMFSHLRRTWFNPADAKFTENLIDLVRQGGYDIVWLDNNSGCKGVCDRVPTESMLKNNNAKYCDGTYCMDEVLLDGFESRLAGVKRDTMIVMHMMGSHGPTYYRRYPDRFRKFVPTCDDADLGKCTRQEIINTYDNTILYTDFVLSSAIDSLKKFPRLESGLVYVSDHGESLGENNIYLHGFPYAFAPKEQIHVPMLIYMSDNMKLYDHIDYECAKKEAAANTYTHDNLFHTVLGIAEIASDKYDPALDLLDPCRTEPLPR